MIDAEKSPHWELDRLYVRESEALNRDLKSLDDMSQAFKGHRARLMEKTPVTIEEFGKIIKEFDAMTVLGQRISAFAQLSFASDTSDQKALAFLAKVDEIMAKLFNETLFFELWWKDLPDGEALPLVEAFSQYAYFLSRLRAFRKHTLSEPEEKVINLKDLTGSESMIKLYDTITNAFRYESPDASAPLDRLLTREELTVFFRSHIPELRAKAYQELYRIYSRDANVLGQIYLVLVRDWHTENVDLRKYPSPRSVRDKSNDIAFETVDSLLKVCRTKGPEVFGRYFKKKAQHLGLKTLRRYDLYAPLLPPEEKYTFSQGLAEVEAAFKAFDPRFASLAMQIPKEAHLSAEIRPGKQSGAFCASTVPGEVPFVLMSYNGNRQDLFTLAHELGHAVHSLLASHLNIFNFHSALPMAETASTMAEMLLASYLKKKAVSKETIDDLNFHLLD
ncbi:MAG: M3 family metallopeptidase, partial [Deltaproteobacteria bacterium]|nr:M3 family metallopeptidase [Deltaproteobacteria bacterium]